MLPRKMTIFCQRQRRKISCLLYVGFVALMLYALYDPSVLAPVVPFLAVINRSRFASGQMEDTAAGPGAALNLDDVRNAEGIPVAQIMDLPFVPRDFNCDDMLTKSGRNLTYTDEYWDHADAFKSALGMNNLMDRATTNEQSWLMQEMVRLPFVNTVCETGFDAGTNSFNWLVGNGDVSVHSFDLANKNYSAEMADFMMVEFADRFTLYPGDTVKTLPEFARKHENDNLRCDIMFVDSTQGAGTITSNVEAFRMLSNRQNNLVVMDAHPSSGKNRQMALEVWKDLVAERVLRNVFQCNFQNIEGTGFTQDGITVGSFIFP